MEQTSTARPIKKPKNDLIPDTPEWVRRKSEANALISGAINHFRSKGNIDLRTYFITAHKDVRSPLSKKYRSHKSLAISLYKQICKIVSATYAGEISDLHPSDKPGMIICSDVSGTKCDVNRGNFDKSNIPHFHAFLFLPFEITDRRTDLAFMHAVKWAIYSIDGMGGRSSTEANPSILVEKFVENKPLWWAVDYSAKARRFAFADQDFEPLVFPFALLLDKNEPKKATDEVVGQRLQRKRDRILDDQGNTIRDLTYDPRNFYASDRCRDMSLRHRALLAENILSKPRDYVPSDRDINRIVTWRGSFDNSKFGELLPLSTRDTTRPGVFWDAVQPTEWGVTASGYIDECACKISLGKEAPPPSLQQELVLPDDYWNYPSSHSWLKTQNYFYQRLGYWRLHFHLFKLAKFQSIHR